MIFSLERGETATDLFGLLPESYPPQLIDSDVPSPDEECTPAGLALALDRLLGQAGFAPACPAWLCTVRSSTRLPDPTDTEWAAHARRVLAAAGIAPPGDRGACPWIALRSQPRTVHILAVLVRRDGHEAPGRYSTYRAVREECQAIGGEHSSRYPDAPLVLPVSGPRTSASPVDTVTITRRPSGAVMTTGGDDLAAALLGRAGFPPALEKGGTWRLLPSAVPRRRQADIASRAARMLRAALYEVTVDDLDTVRITDPSDPQTPYQAGSEVLTPVDPLHPGSRGATLPTPPAAPTPPGRARAAPPQHGPYRGGSAQRH